MAGGTAGATKKRKAVNGTTKQVVNAQKKKGGETGKTSKGETSFLNEEAKTLFETCFCHRPLLVERGVALGELVNTKCPKFFEGRNWENIFDVKKDDKTYNNAVRLFYANLHNFDKVGHTLKSVVWGACIDLPHYIFQLIMNAYELQDSRRSLPFPILITNIVKFYGVVIELG
ncbi:unnamed protein product [Ilex paraguariensis]|uniref:Uncharacterized protein n=1 Tax=Ilex paraguariensis TaxID=185542 RepID=A0ABC8URB5_9AQUA